MLLANRIKVDGNFAKDMDLQINLFSEISLDEQLISGLKPRYIMLNKPIGVVSATKDEIHKTVIDLLPEDIGDGLHIVGRLDLNTSGLLLLTNDSEWSQRLMSPSGHVEKEYMVTLQNELTTEYQSAFLAGMYFDVEKTTTLPAKLDIIAAYQARVSIVEGKYHQIKRMFGRFRNPVIALHRHRIGNLCLDDKLPSGEWRELTTHEIKLAAEKINML